MSVSAIKEFIYKTISGWEHAKLKAAAEVRIDFMAYLVCVIDSRCEQHCGSQFFETRLTDRGSGGSTPVRLT
jgi:hypothetical protein